LNKQQALSLEAFVFHSGMEFADHAAQVQRSNSYFGFSDEVVSEKSSTIPTMEQSVGRLAQPSAIRAELPETAITRSPTPALTVSTATM